MSSTDEERQSRSSPTWLLWVAVGVVIALQGGLGFAVFQLAGSDMATRGQFGDMFGGVNTLFTGLAFAGLIYTIFLQRQDLEMQANELKLTREEMQRTTEAQVGSQQAHAEQVVLLQASARLNVIATLTDNYTKQMESAERVADTVGIEQQVQQYQTRPANSHLSMDEAREQFLQGYSLNNPGPAMHYSAWVIARRRRLELLEMLEKAFEEVESVSQDSRRLNG